ncbi:hypothetical protein V7S43_005833 [Phytophthora oleae]|uniref:Elicitin n=1 Tax=Phytophthora oleae TaxID=2107226 RepID=A0ABD3FWU2_9STRA
MFALPTFVMLLLVPILVIRAEHCSTQTLTGISQSLSSDPSYTSCQDDSSYMLQSLEPPTLSQSRKFCSSPACRALLDAALESGALPDCDVVLGTQTFKLTDAMTRLASKCASSRVRGLRQERAVDNRGVHSKTQRISSHVATVLGHSAPMDEVGDVAGLLLGV